MGMVTVHGTGGHGADTGANNGMPCLIVKNTYFTPGIFDICIDARMRANDLRISSVSRYRPQPVF